MSRVLVVLALAAALVAVPADSAAAAACSCARTTPQERVERAAAVFSATATRVTEHWKLMDGGHVTAVLRADHVYKGEAAAEFEVSTRAQGAACGYRFLQGARYLVFAVREGSGLRTTLCSGNRRLPDGPDGGLGPLPADLVAALGAPTTPAPGAGAARPAAEWNGGALLIGGLAAALLLAAALVVWWWRRRRA
ncbi:hypothetical protein HII36_48335 [Nonomuraea sp. NN258]|uniref:hypothetical protein n=1 Tax=Nonomuraea antri TaxID=2730852 RepID=UPI001568F029|nr:hypothetical protein [Nonomuraea antri]NRQ39588.1 hypothetical protein [Nonomuraea antri]